MIRLLALLVALGLASASPASAALAFVQKVSCAASASDTCTTASITTTTGNLIVVGAGYQEDAFVSITDNKSNTYIEAIAEVACCSATNKGQQRYKANASGGASHTFTLTGASGSFYGEISVAEISGAATASPLDKTMTGTETSTDHSSGSTATTSQANEILIGFGTSRDGATLTTDTGAGWTEIDRYEATANIPLITGYRIVSATGTYAYTYTSSPSLEAVQGISTWKEAAAGGGAAPQQRMLRGMGR